MNTQITTKQQQIAQMQARIESNLGWRLFDLDNIRVNGSESMNYEDAMLDLMFAQVQPTAQPDEDELLEWTMFCLEASEQPLDMVEILFDQMLSQA